MNRIVTPPSVAVAPVADPCVTDALPISSAGLRTPEPVQSGVHPLSPGQQRLWLLNRLDPESAAYNECFALRLRGTLDWGALELALQSVVIRHEVLRTMFPYVDGSPVQKIADELPIRLGYSECDGGEAYLASALQAYCAAPFDFARGPMVRAALFRLSDRDHVFVVAMHHIVCDAWSMDIFRRELAAFYNSRIAGTEARLPVLPLQFAEYSEREIRLAEESSRQLDYWKDQLRGDLPGLDVPTDRPRASIRSTRGSRYRGGIPASTLQGLKQLGREIGASPFMVLTAAVDILLFRYTGKEDVRLGAPISRRIREDVQNLIGFFTNTIVLRSRVSASATVRSLIEQVRDVCLDAYENSDVPFERVVEELRPHRESGHNPLFEIMLQYRPTGPASADFSHLETTFVEVHNGAAKFDLSFTFLESGGALDAVIEYATDLFDATTIDRLSANLNTLIEGMIADPAHRISELPLLTASERDRVLLEWNQTEADYAREQTVHGLFESQVAAGPDAVAVIFGRRQLTYAELNDQSDRLAARLAAAGCKRGTFVGIFLERSIQAVVALLAVLKTGAAYVPLDPSWPKVRLALALEDSAAPVILTSSSLRHNLPDTSARILSFDLEQPRVAELLPGPCAGQASPDAPAYLIYTSGSTGAPKGVVVTHGSVVNLLADMRHRLAVTVEDRFLFLTTLSFDIAGLEVFLPLTTGAKVVVASVEEAKDPARLARRLTASHVTVMQATPATWRMLIERNWIGMPGLRVISGGEALAPDLAEKLMERCEAVWNLYGPTETTVYSTGSKLEPHAPVTIGRPISNTRTYILDADRNPSPIGVPGELYIGGTGVAQGYWRRPELTSERFVPDPFDGGTHSRLYRTGDRVRYLADGSIEYLGRTDHQVKVRGFRVELGEIETTLRLYPGVRDAAVLQPADRSEELVAWFIAEGGTSPDTREMRSFLQKRLPEYAVPKALSEIDRWPLTSNGKLDRKALAARPLALATARSRQSAPQTSLEHELVCIWEEVLGIPSVSTRDNFFDLGGHSLAAARMFAIIEKRLGRTVPVSTLYLAPTVEGLSRAIDTREAALPSTVMQLRGSAKGPPLFLIRRFRQDNLLYIDLVRQLHDDRRVFLVDLHSMDVFTGIRESALAGAEAIRRVWPSGPYAFAGVCVDGLVSLEIAREFADAGEEVGLVGLIDTFLPRYFSHLPLQVKVGYQVRRLAFHLASLTSLTGAQRLKYARGLLGGAQTSISRMFLHFLYLALRRAGCPVPRRLIDFHELGRVAAAGYGPRAYAGSVTLFRPADKGMRVHYSQDLGWNPLLPQLRVLEASGDHISMLQAPFVDDLADKLESCLDELAPTGVSSLRTNDQNLT